MFVPDISDNLRSVMQKSIAIRAEQRYQSAEEFIIALDSVTAQLGPKVRPTTTSNENISRVAALLVQSRQCRQERDYEEAIKLLEEAKKIVPGDAGVCLELGRIFNLIGRQQDAVRVLCEALAENPDNYVLLRDLGITYMGLKDSAKALEMLDQSLKLNPNQPRVLALVKRLKK
jgi:tetratricopeptide (TPR) repeat protein